MNSFHIKLFPDDKKGKATKYENYSYDNPRVVVGNLIIGDMYLEPQGTVTINNHDSGEKCELEFKPRGWSTKNNCMIHGIIKDA